MSQIEDVPAPIENKHHQYRSSDIPWYVRLYWVLFWCFVAYYTITYLIPDMQYELVSPP